MINKIDRRIFNEKLKFESDFKKFKKIIILNEEGRRSVNNYKEFLQEFSLKEDIDIRELESIFISFVRCIAMMKDINIVVFDKSDSFTKNNNSKNKFEKYIYLDDLESIINIIEELGIARILIIY